MKPFDPNRLPVQLIISFLVVVFLTAALVGLPSIWLLKNQLGQQAWSRVDQAQRTAISLYEKKFFELKNAANLTAQRPTLLELLEQKDFQSLEDYLLILQSGVNLDLINICQSEATVAGTERNIPLCAAPMLEGYYLYGNDAWLIARTYLNGQERGEAIVGIKLDHEFAVEIKDQIDQDQGLFYDNRLMSSSFQPGMEKASNLRDCLMENTEQLPHLICPVGGEDHYITVSLLDGKGLSVAVAMDISNNSIAENRLILWMLAAMIGIAGMVTLLGVFLSRRISRPLVKLSKHAFSFSRGDLDSPVVTESKLVEIIRVAKALEDARMDLQGMLKSLQDERDWSENLLSSIVEGIVTLDQTGRITFFSRGAERLTGLPGSDVLDHHVNDVFRVIDSPVTFYDLVSTSASGSYQKVDVSLIDNLTTSLAITSARLPRSGVEEQETALVIRDISEEEAVHRLLGHFFANVSHELKTPLSALQASIEMLLDPEGNLTPEEKNSLYISLHLGISRLHTLVDNLLESANIEARRFRIAPRVIDLGSIIAEAVQMMQPLLFKYDQHLSMELPPDRTLVRADKRRIVQVLVNLISNANKYGPPGEEISLEVDISDQFARLAVKDRGSGIPVEHRNNLFERFVFPHAKNEISRAGAGLGLSVVKAIVEAHGGCVGMDDRPGGGSIFWFTLPRASEEK